MRELLCARKLLRKSYVQNHRITQKRRRKRSHWAHPRSFTGRSRGRPAHYNCSRKLTQLSDPWEMPPEKRSNPRRTQGLYESFCNYWSTLLSPRSIMVWRTKEFPDGSWKKCSGRLCSPTRVPRCGIFSATRPPPLS